MYLPVSMTMNCFFDSFVEFNLESINSKITFARTDALK